MMHVLGIILQLPPIKRFAHVEQGPTAIETSAEEKSVSLSVSPLALSVIFPRIEFFPDAGRKDMLVALIPSPVYYLGEIRVIACTFQALELIRGRNPCVCTFGGWRRSLERVIGCAGFRRR